MCSACADGRRARHVFGMSALDAPSVYRLMPPGRSCWRALHCQLGNPAARALSAAFRGYLAKHLRYVSPEPTFVSTRTVG